MTTTNKYSYSINSNIISRNKRNFSNQESEKNSNNQEIDGIITSCYMGDDEEVILRSFRTVNAAITTASTTIAHDMQQHQQQQFDDTKIWTVGKISILILAAFILSDMIFYMVDAQMESFEAQEHYDALSADVIRPAFRYHHHHAQGDQQPSSSSSSRIKARPLMGPGASAIFSVITTFGPILSFAGEINLRREDYWTNGWFGSVHYIVEHVRDAVDVSSTNMYSYDDDNDDHDYNTVNEIPRGGAAVTGRTRRTKKLKPKKARSTSSTTSKEFILSSSDCFVPLKDIARLTLKDVAMSFRFAVESTQKDFNAGKFLSGALPRVKKLVNRMSTATLLARETNDQAPITGKAIASSGDIDAVNFCAAMRVFAEWRVLRQVPPGYKGYAVGIGVGQKDIVQNIAKIEQAIHNYVDYRARNNDKEHNTSNGNTKDHHKILSSPTLRDLLQYEVDINLHDNTKLPRLKEKSAAMGLLWVRRQLIYQTAIFKNVLDVPTRFDSSRSAVQSAYDEVYGSLHGWAVQKIFSYSFKAAPEGIEIYRYMNPHRLEEVEQEARSKIMRVPEQKQKFDRPLIDLESNNPVEKLIFRFGRHIGKEWDKVANNAVNEWEKHAGNIMNEWEKHSGNIINEWVKVTNNVGQLFGHKKRRLEHRQHDRRQRRLLLEIHDEKGDSKQTTMTAEEKMIARELEIRNYINKEMRKDAYDNIKVYLEVADPLLDDLSRLTEEFNMDDPTKV